MHDATLHCRVTLHVLASLFLGVGYEDDDTESRVVGGLSSTGQHNDPLLRQVLQMGKVPVKDLLLFRGGASG